MTTKMEQRSFSGMQLRAAAGFVLEGVAASYNTPSRDLGGFTEKIAPGAFTRSLREGKDVKCLFNHDANLILGRVKNGTLTLTDTPEGLAFRCQLDQRSQMHKDLHASVQRGDIDECSFAFIVRDGGQKWNGSLRTVTDVDLCDVSVVTYPAYPTGTSASARSAHYALNPQDWRAKHNAALARLAPVVAADNAALAEDRAHDKQFEAAMRDVRRWALED